MRAALRRDAHVRAGQSAHARVSANHVQRGRANGGGAGEQPGCGEMRLKHRPSRSRGVLRGQRARRKAENSACSSGGVVREGLCPVLTLDAVCACVVHIYVKCATFHCRGVLG